MLGTYADIVNRAVKTAKQSSSLPRPSQNRSCCAAKTPPACGDVPCSDVGSEGKGGGIEPCSTTYPEPWRSRLALYKALGKAERRLGHVAQALGPAGNVTAA